MDVDNSIGRVIGNYRIIAKVGEGGFGYVYRAEHIIPQFKDHVVAIKIARAKQNSPEVRAKFLREARMLLDLKHHSILRLLDMGDDKNDLYLMTDYAPHGSLRSRISQSSHLLPIGEVCDILSQIGEALQYIHEQQVIHCDLKPENILFIAPGEALLADFGIAKIVNDVGVDRNETIGHGTGTPPYMAPEQINGKPEIASDQYAFACMTYELFTGRTPFAGTNHIQTLRRHLTEQAADPRNFNDKIPEYRAKAILKGLEKEPSERHMDMNAFLAALKLPHTQDTIISNLQTSIVQEDENELLEKANTQLGSGRLEDALKIYVQITDEINPKSAKAYWGKGQVLMLLEDNSSALTAYSRAVELDPKFVPAYFGRGEAHNALKHYQEALKTYQEIEQFSPDTILYMKIAKTYIELKADKKALEAYDTAICYESNPSKIIDIRYKKINLLIKREYHYREVVKEYDEIIRLSPDPITAHYKKIRFLYNNKHYDKTFITNELLAAFNQVIELQPDRIDLRYEKIALLEELRRPKEAYAVYDAIIERNPDAFNIYREKAVFLEKHDSIKQVPTVYDQFIKRSPNALYAYEKKLEVLLKLKWPEDILTTCDELINLVTDPNRLRYYYYIKLEFLEGQKQYIQVVKMCDKIIALGLKGSNIDYADVYYRKGKAHEELAVTEHGSKFSHKRFVNRLTMRLSPPHHYKQAVYAYDEALQSSPDNPEYRHSLGDLLELLGKYAAAERIRKNAKRTWINDSNFVFWIFVLLPVIINIVPVTLLLAFQKQPGVSWAMLTIAMFCISSIGACLILPKTQKEQKYRLYDRSRLVYPIFGFVVEWLVIGLLVSWVEYPIDIVFSLLVFIALGFLINSFVYLWIDANEEQTIFIIYKGIWKGIQGVFYFLAVFLYGITVVYKAIYDDIKEAKRKRVMAAQNVLTQDIQGKTQKSKYTFTKQKNQLMIRKCSRCHGKGTIRCSHCKGKGKLKINELIYNSKKRPFSSLEECFWCNGEGKDTCDRCDGTGLKP